MIAKIQRKLALSRKGATDLIKACIACFFQNIALILPAFLLYSLIRDLLQGTLPSGRIGFYIIGCVICLVIILLTTTLQYRSTFFATYRESGVLRISLAEQLRKLPLSFFAKKDLSDLTSTIMADCTFLEQAFSHFVPELVGSIFSTAVIGIGLFFADWRMALAAFWVFPVSLAIVLLTARTQERLNNRQMDAKLDCADGIQECLEALRDLKSNNAQAGYLNGLSKKICAVEKSAVTSEVLTQILAAGTTWILKLGIATTALTGAVLLAKGGLSPLTYFMFLLVVSRLYDPLETVLVNLMLIIYSKTNINRMNEILLHPKQEGTEILSNTGFDITFDHVDFSYDNKEAVLSDVSFTARQGEVTALVGPSGGGKTTASRLAARFWDIQSGRITVGGMDISQINPETLLSLYSIVFQDVTLFNNTIMENIRIGRTDATDEEVMAVAKLANCDEFVTRLPDQWNSLIGENGCTLSGGERQRISIARAFLKNAPIILLDEATASLDVENETLIQTALSRLIKDKTVLIIAHRMRTIAGADQTVVLAEGKVREQGTPAELLERGGLYSHMAALQAESQSWAL